MSLPESNCPSCDKRLDAASTLENDDIQPKSGDVSICLYCASFLTFTENLSIRLLTTEEIAELEDNIRIVLMKMRRAIIARQRELADL